MRRRLILVYVAAFSTLIGGMVGALEIGKFFGLVEDDVTRPNLSATNLGNLTDPISGAIVPRRPVLTNMAEPGEALYTSAREEVIMFYGTWCVPPTDNAMHSYFTVETPPQGMRLTIGEQNDRQYILISTLDWFSENEIANNQIQFVAPARGNNYLLYTFDNLYAVEIRKDSSNPDNVVWISARGFPGGGPGKISGDMRAQRC